MSEVYIGIGSNVDREKNILSCMNVLRKKFKNLITSPVYETNSMGFSGPNFYNLVCRFSAQENLSDLKKILNEIETTHGRTFSEEKFSSRTLDIDILYYDNLIFESEKITIPREEIIRYDFVLKPLVDIAPDFIHPKLNLSNKEIFDSHQIEKLIIGEVKIEQL